MSFAMMIDGHMWVRRDAIALSDLSARDLKWVQSCEDRATDLEAVVATIRTHYEHAKRPYDAERKQGYEGGPIKDAVVSALSLLLVNVEDILKIES